MKRSRFRHYGFWAVLLLFMAATPACEKKADVVAEMDVAFQWNPPGTSVERNPEIRVTHVPESTVRFSVELEDLDLKSYNHGGGFCPYDGSGVIPAGGLDGYYQGPTPPPGVIHRYAFTVKALDADGVVIGQGSHTRRYPEND